MKPPTITGIEMSTIDVVLKMERGYVLGFSRRQLAHFFADLGIDIDALPGSNAHRLREFLKTTTPHLAAMVLERLLEYRGEDEYDHEASSLIRYRQIIARLRGTQVVVPQLSAQIDILSLEYVSELDSQTNKRLADREFEGAITTARTMLEAVLRELESELTGAPADYAGNLPKQYREVAKRLRIDDERDDLDENFKQVVRGLVQVVHGLAPIRNKMSDSHPRERKPAPHHARVVANSAKTVAGFLIESYLFQRERGVLPSSSSGARK